MTEHIINEVATFVIEILRKDASATGSTLGTLVKQRFPTFDVKRYPGKLSGIIRDYCGGRVIVIGKAGGVDPVYAMSTSRTEESPDAPPVEATSQPPPISPPKAQGESYAKRTFVTAWSAFVTPDSPGKLFLTPDGNLSVKERGAVLFPGEREIDKLSRESHGRIAKEFVDTAPLTILEKEKAEQLLSQHASLNFWPMWAHFVKTVSEGRLYHFWNVFRATKIKALFLERLANLGVAPVVAKTLLQDLEDSKTAIKRQFSTNKSHPDIEQPTKTVSSCKAPLTALVHRLIDNLSEAELRALRFPLGAVLDATARDK